MHFLTYISEYCQHVSTRHWSIETPLPPSPPPDPGQIGGIEKGPADQITPRPTAPGQNLEINSSPLGSNKQGLKKNNNKQTKQKETVHTELIRNKIHFNKAIVFF